MTRLNELKKKMITFENIALHEMIGLNTIVSTSPNGQIVGLTGTIVDETKSMFTIKSKMD